jgi:DNA replication protein DnaC
LAAREAQIAAELEALRNPPMEKRFARIVGEDYAGCRLDTFQIAPDWPKEATAQAESVLRRLRLISGSVREAVKAGTGLVLCGAPGVGKDHLAAAVMWSALSAGLTCKWTNGGKFAAAAMDQFSDDRQLDRIWLEDWTKPDVLTISDPDGNRQDGLTPHVRDTLYKVVDGRLRDGKQTWITINGDKSQVWIDRLGERIWSRLTHKAWVLHCSWPGHRKMRAELR